MSIFQGDTHQYLFSKFNVQNPKEMRAATELMSGAMKQPLEDLETLHWKDFLSKYDHYSLKQWLVEYHNITKSSVNMIALFLNIEALLERSLAEIAIDQCDHGNSKVFDQIVGGFDKLPRAFLPYLGKDIVYKAKVTTIKHDENSVQVRFVYQTINKTYEF